MTVQLALLPESYSTAETTANRPTNLECSSTLSGMNVGAIQRLSDENRQLRVQLQSRSLRDIIGQSGAILRVKEQIVGADEDRPVLILGEPGSGSQTLAQAIHSCGRRAHRPFVKLDCGLLTANALENELFEGSQARINQDNPGGMHGRLRSAAGGTLYLKDIDAVPVSLQKKLAGMISGVGSQLSMKGPSRDASVQFLASSHADLTGRVRHKLFHNDLLDVFSECTIESPPLRARIEDVGLLTEHFLAQAAVADGIPAKRLTIDALNLLQRYYWPGNVAELRNTVRRAFTLNTGELLTDKMLSPWISGGLDDSLGSCAGISLREMEQKLIETTFARCEGNRERTAQVLQIGLRTLSGKLREYGYPPRGGPRSKLQATQLKAA